MSSGARSPAKVCMLLLHDMLDPLDPRVYKEARSLLEHGYRVHVVCWERGSGRSDPHEEYQGIDVHRVTLRYAPGSGPMEMFLTFRRLRRVMCETARALRPDIVHAHDLETLPPGIDLKRSLDVPLVFDAHEDWPALESMQARVKGVLAGLVQRWYLRGVDAVLTVSEGVASRLKGAPTPPVVVHNSRPLIEMSGPSDPDIREKLGLEGNDVVIGYLGRIWDDWGYGTALRALKRVGAGNVRLLVVGGPEEAKRRYERLARELGVDERCIFTGHVPYASVRDHLSAMDIGLLLLGRGRLYDVSLPNRLFEYMGAGVPVISGDAPTLRRMVERVGCGRVVPPGDVDALVRAMDELVQDDLTRRQMAVSGIRAFREEFCWEKQEVRLLETYSGLLQR